MKKGTMLLLAAMVALALAGCGARAGGHVVDYHVDVPGGFVETELEGAAACWTNLSDGSSINLNVTGRDASGGFGSITAGTARAALESALKDRYGTQPAVTDRYFTRDEVCGLPAYQYSYELTVGGRTVSQTVVCVNADRRYTFTYTDMTGAWAGAFEASAKNIQLTIE